MSPRISYSFYPHREVSLDLTDRIVEELVVRVSKNKRPRGHEWMQVRGYHADDAFDWESGKISFFKNEASARIYRAWNDSMPERDETRPPALLRTKNNSWAVWTQEGH